LLRPRTHEARPIETYPWLVVNNREEGLAEYLRWQELAQAQEQWIDLSKECTSAVQDHDDLTSLRYSAHGSSPAGRWSYARPLRVTDYSTNKKVNYYGPLLDKEILVPFPLECWHYNLYTKDGTRPPARRLTGEAEYTETLVNN